MDRFRELVVGYVIEVSSNARFELELYLLRCDLGRILCLTELCPFFEDD